MKFNYNIRKAVIAIFLAVNGIAHAQRHLSLSLHQDPRLSITGDDSRGYEAGTLNLLVRLKAQDNQQEFGYWLVFPEYQFANIEGDYQRYSFNVGYTFNQLLINRLEASATAGYGCIDRFGKTTFSYGSSGELAYNLNGIKLSMISMLTQRTDLGFFYGKTKLVFSAFIGLEFNLN